MIVLLLPRYLWASNLDWTLELLETFWDEERVILKVKGMMNKKIKLLSYLGNCGAVHSLSIELVEFLVLFRQRKLNGQRCQSIFSFVRTWSRLCAKSCAELRLNYQEKNHKGGPCRKSRRWGKAELWVRVPNMGEKTTLVWVGGIQDSRNTPNFWGLCGSGTMVGK